MCSLLTTPSSSLGLYPGLELGLEDAATLPSSPASPPAAGQHTPAFFVNNFYASVQLARHLLAAARGDLAERGLHHLVTRALQGDVVVHGNLGRYAGCAVVVVPLPIP